ncbi:hypothetical protein ACGFY9_39820 [Streptomyces sp. NPDC048504]|uniref:hypothetical protein n=1 Tax=Streptomyces sp. NPDC048504 TaxID=3365559 RepID=UPI0037181DDB
MARTKSSTPKTNVASPAKKTSSTQAGTLDFAIVPAIFLVIFGTFTLIASMAGAFSFTFIEPLVSALLATFGLLSAWKIARREAIRKYVRVVSWVLAITFTLAVVFWFGGGNDNSCTGFMGVQSSCMDNNRVMIAVLLLNPFSLLIWAGLALGGLAGLWIKPKKS